VDEELEQIRQKRMNDMMRVVGTAMTNGGSKAKPEDLDGATLGPFLEKNKIALVDVWAAWCGPCRMMEPVIEELAHELAGKAGVGKINSDDNYETVAHFGVQGIPTFLFFKDGQYATRLVGARPKRDFLDVIRQLQDAAPGAGPEVA
jgi:thioredoxin 1